MCALCTEYVTVPSHSIPYGTFLCCCRYCSLLTRGNAVSSGSVPVKTAPNALRHWTAAQKALLEDSPKGKKLLDLQSKQEASWKAKYDRRTNKSMTYEQFEWSMEAVHSRAFKGQYGINPIRNIWSVGAPLGAALGCVKTLQDDVLFGFDNTVFALLALAASPLLLNLVFPDQGDVVLLPLIDSANHLESADSSISFDPLEGTFSLEVGPNCIVTEEDSKSQLYISYGPKSDLELLLNYGFLPSVPCSDGEDEASRDAQRRQLAAQLNG